LSIAAFTSRSNSACRGVKILMSSITSESSLGAGFCLGLSDSNVSENVKLKRRATPAAGSKSSVASNAPSRTSCCRSEASGRDPARGAIFALSATLTQETPSISTPAPRVAVPRATIGAYPHPPSISRCHSCEPASSAFAGTEKPRISGISFHSCADGA
jgi:hypothetical protein